MKKFLSFLLLLLFVVTASAQATSSVEGKTYEGSINGMATLKFDFKSNGNAVCTMSAFGSSESKSVTYTQDGSKIIVHAQNGDMTLTQSDKGVLSTYMNGLAICLLCTTPEPAVEQIDRVAGHSFSGDFGNNKNLTLSFSNNGIVEVSITSDYQNKTLEWYYTQKNNTVVMTDPMGRRVTLTLDSANQLKGMFTIINVTLKLVK